MDEFGLPDDQFARAQALGLTPNQVRDRNLAKSMVYQRPRIKVMKQADPMVIDTGNPIDDLQSNLTRDLMIGVPRFGKEWAYGGHDRVPGFVGPPLGAGNNIIPLVKDAFAEYGDAFDAYEGGRAARGALGGKPREALSWLAPGISDEIGLTRPQDRTNSEKLLNDYGVVSKGDPKGSILGAALDAFATPANAYRFAALPPVQRFMKDEGGSFDPYFLSKNPELKRSDLVGGPKHSTTTDDVMKLMENSGVPDAKPFVRMGESFPEGQPVWDDTANAVLNEFDPNAHFLGSGVQAMATASYKPTLWSPLESNVSPLITRFGIQDPGHYHGTGVRYGVNEAGVGNDWFGLQPLRSIELPGKGDRNLIIENLPAVQTEGPYKTLLHHRDSSISGPASDVVAGFSALVPHARKVIKNDPGLARFGGSVEFRDLHPGNIGVNPYGVVAPGATDMSAYVTDPGAVFLKDVDMSPYSKLDPTRIQAKHILGIGEPEGGQDVWNKMLEFVQSGPRNPGIRFTDPGAKSILTDMMNNMYKVQDNVLRSAEANAGISKRIGMIPLPLEYRPKSFPASGNTASFPINPLAKDHPDLPSNWNLSAPGFSGQAQAPGSGGLANPSRPVQASDNFGLFDDMAWKEASNSAEKKGGMNHGQAQQPQAPSGPIKWDVPSDMNSNEAEAYLRAMGAMDPNDLATPEPKVPMQFTPSELENELRSMLIPDAPYLPTTSDIELGMGRNSNTKTPFLPSNPTLSDLIRRAQMEQGIRGSTPPPRPSDPGSDVRRLMDFLGDF